MKIQAAFVILLILFGNIYCYSNFTGLEICALYQDYASIYGNYSTKGVPSSLIYPSARIKIQAAYDKPTNTLWVFGGEAYDESGANGYLNDLWKYDLNTNEWTWLSGSNQVGQTGHYVQKGVPHADNIPGSRNGGCLWVSDNGTIWLFGGWGYPPNGNQVESELNDLWKFEDGMWTFVSGSDSTGASTVYPPQDRVPSPTAHPGARQGMACWKDNNGHFWLYGGYFWYYFCDTWRFDGTHWAYWSGSKLSNSYPSYGSPKQFDHSYHPGYRMYSSVATSSGSSAYLFGGLCLYGSCPNKISFGDIWKFDSDKGWAYWDGIVGKGSPKPGNKSEASEDSTIGSKYHSYSVVDDSDNLWIFGGYGVGPDQNPQYEGTLNTLWVYDQNYFIWMEGDPYQFNSDLKGTPPGVFSSSNWPGSYSGGIAFIDNKGMMNIYGLYNGTTKSNTLWKIGFEHECFGKSICRHPFNEVCSGHGKCISYNNCSCEDGYVGEECQFVDAYCFGKYSPDPNVCSGRGKCVGTDECHCNAGYGGEECQYTYCFGKLSNDSTVCSSRGSCSEPDQCTCNTGYVGEECQFAYCFGKLSNDSNVCSSRGDCIWFNKCNCVKGYYGDECQNQCPSPPEPTIQISESGNSIEIKIEGEFNTSISTVCSELFEDSNSFGEGAKCEFKSNQTLEIQLGNDYSLGSFIVLKNHTLQVIGPITCDNFIKGGSYQIPERLTQQQEFNYLWLLTLLVIPVGGILIAATIIVIVLLKKKKIPGYGDV